MTRQVIAAGIEVHRHLGPGLPESAYEECLAYELVKGELHIHRQKPVPVVYKETLLNNAYRIDILVENAVVLELKSVDMLAPIREAQILTYMKLAEKRIGLLINFNVTVLKAGLKRYVL